MVHSTVSADEALRLLDCLEEDHDFLRTVVRQPGVTIVRCADGSESLLNLFAFEKDAFPHPKTGGPCREGAAILSAPDRVDFHGSWIGGELPVCVTVPEEAQLQAFRKRFDVEVLRRSEDQRLRPADFRPVDAEGASILRFGREDRDAFFRTVPLPNAQAQYDRFLGIFRDVAAFVAVDGGTPASIVYAALRTDYRFPTVEIFGLGTLPAFRGKGFAKRVVSAAVRHGLESAERCAYVVEETNEASRRVAAALGFRKAGMRIVAIGRPKTETRRVGI